MQIWNKDGTIIEYPTASIDSVTFTKKMVLGSWEDKINCPTLEQIRIHNDTSGYKAPYITAAFRAVDENDGYYIGYSVDFKADFIPPYTYCGLNCFRLDYDSLRKEWGYDKIDNGGYPFAYTGFQRKSKKDSPEHISLLSIWETYCYRGEKIDTIRPTLIYPEEEETKFYNNEGLYASYRPEYLWKPGKWYRLVILLGTSEATGCTTIEQRVCDLETKEWTKLCVFDLGAPNIFFKGSVLAFLENWCPKTAGEIRTMELKNVRTLNAYSKTWINKTKVYLTSAKDGKFSGSSQYGTDETTFWMISTGVPNCATKQNPGDFSVNYSETGNPLETR